ncbi:MAG TPA: YtxH domain-containing protein [Thermoanaerobaculia bacterium]|nr:YtxH domain-containing protein [Thermoanaerobaculia bacterium]
MFTRKKETRVANYSFTFVAGALIGAAVALLYAPKPGKKLQKDVKNFAEDSADNIQKFVKNVKKAVNA